MLLSCLGVSHQALDQVCSIMKHYGESLPVDNEDIEVDNEGIKV